MKKMQQKNAQTTNLRGFKHKGSIKRTRKGCQTVLVNFKSRKVPTHS